MFSSSSHAPPQIFSIPSGYSDDRSNSCASDENPAPIVSRPASESFQISLDPSQPIEAIPHPRHPFKHNLHTLMRVRQRALLARMLETLAIDVCWVPETRIQDSGSAIRLTSPSSPSAKFHIRIFEAGAFALFFLLYCGWLLGKDKPAPDMIVIMEFLGSLPVPDSSTRSIEDSVRTLFDQFAALNLTLSDIARLHLLFIQFSTRFDDWQSGALDPNYFLQKLSQLERQLSDFVGHDLPVTWTFSWDSCKKRYFYTDLATGRTQWEAPKVRSTGSEAKDRDDQTEEFNKPAKTVRSINNPMVPNSPSPTFKIRGNVLTSEDETIPVKSTPDPLASQSTNELVAPPAADTEFVRDSKQIDRTEHLKAQLREFEEVCRAFEDLDASVPASVIETNEPQSTSVSYEFSSSDLTKFARSKSREKRTKIYLMSPTFGGKTIPRVNVIQLFNTKLRLHTSSISIDLDTWINI
ncbi:unnamed protein product [Echinostoma caproni]|uniref:WW domain-containing protein n=1 Tax=Echinostoma caproni TaxID=27848 RepID=A0A183A5W8_9TREM|nr:unnamed protein product [Echinostoma caproni]